MTKTTFFCMVFVRKVILKSLGGTYTYVPKVSMAVHGGVEFRPLGVSDSEYTVVSISANYPSNAQIDFQVKVALYNES